MSTHTPGPWVVLKRPGYCWDIGPANGPLVAFCLDTDAERIVECVNACEGIADPAAFVAAVRELREAAELAVLWLGHYKHTPMAVGRSMTIAADESRLRAALDKVPR
jgi:hypothetical protein